MNVFYFARGRKEREILIIRAQERENYYKKSERGTKRRAEILRRPSIAAPGREGRSREAEPYTEDGQTETPTARKNETNKHVRYERQSVCVGLNVSLSLSC